MELIDLKQSMEASLDLLRMGKNDEILFYIFKFYQPLNSTDEKSSNYQVQGKTSGILSIEYKDFCI